MNCPICKKIISNEKYKYEKRDEKFEDENPYINYQNILLTCMDCNITFNSQSSAEDLDKFYSIVSNTNVNNKVFNRFSEFNSRFFSQVLYFLQFFKIKNNCSILEIGPNINGISKTIKLFQEKIKYYYFDSATMEKKKDIFKLGNYYHPSKSELPKVDLIWMSHCMEHIHPQLLIPTFEHFKKSLNDDGKIFIEIPDQLNPLTKLTIPHTIFFTKKSIYKMFENLDLKVIAFNEIEPDKVNINNNLKNSNDNKETKKKNLSIIQKLYLLIQKKLPDRFVKKYVFKNFVKNGPYCNEKIIRIIVKKKQPHNL